MTSSLSTISIPPEQAECLGTLTSSYRAAPLSDADIEHALRQPIWPEGRTKPAVFDLIQPGEKTCLVVSDHTRKTAVDRILPVLLKGLRLRGCRPEDCFILVASGIHRHTTMAELERILGQSVFRTFNNRILFHDPDDENNLVTVGKTRRGHTVRINRHAMEADRLVLLGAAIYHYYAGFGGGRKSLVPGLAAHSTIAHNHSLTLDQDCDQLRPGVEIGRLDGNPVAEEMLESARMCDPDFIINTVLTPDGQLAGVFAGDLDLAHRAACRLVERIDRVDIQPPADFVIASAGNASNWIQSHKALFNASQAIQEGGQIILEASCPEGLGDEQFRHWVTQPMVADIYCGLRKSPEVSGQTALSTRIRGAKTILVTRMNPKDAADLHMQTAPDLDTAVRQVLAEFARRGTGRPTYYRMPDALSLVPFVTSCINHP